MLRTSKLVHVDPKHLALYIQNLVEKRMRFFLAFKTYRKWLKNCKNQTMLEKHKYMYFAVWGLKHCSQICKNTQNKVSSPLLDPWLPSIPKWSPLKVFSAIILLLLTLRTRSSVWNLKKTPAISLYWFAAQQQTGTCRRQTSGSIYSKFSGKENEVFPSL